MNKICFIGAPGVGKSLLYKELVNSRKLNSHTWLTPAEARVLIVKNNRKKGLLHFLKWVDSERSIFYVLTKLYNRKMNALLSGLLNESFINRRSIYSPLFDIAFKGIGAEVLDPVSRMLAVDFFIRIAKLEMLLENFELYESVIFDDSIWQSLRNVRNYFYKNGLDLLISLPKPDFVIYCHSKVDIIFKQIKQREVEGKCNTCHFGLNDFELQRSILKDIRNSEYKVKLLKKCGIKVLSVNTDNTIIYNTRVINDFLRDNIL